MTQQKNTSFSDKLLYRYIKVQRSCERKTFMNINTSHCLTLALSRAVNYFLHGTMQMISCMDFVI